MWWVWERMIWAVMAMSGRNICMRLCVPQHSYIYDTPRNQMIYLVYSTSQLPTSTNHLPCFKCTCRGVCKRRSSHASQVLVCLSACVDVSLFLFGGEEAHAQTTSRGTTRPEYPNRRSGAHVPPEGSPQGTPNHCVPDSNNRRGKPVTTVASPSWGDSSGQACPWNPERPPAASRPAPRS